MSLESAIGALNDLEFLDTDDEKVRSKKIEELERRISEVTVSEDPRKYDVLTSCIGAYEPDEEATERVIGGLYSLERGTDSLLNLLYEREIDEVYWPIRIGVTDLETPNQCYTPFQKKKVSQFLADEGVIGRTENERLLKNIDKHLSDREGIRQVKEIEQGLRLFMTEKVKEQLENEGPKRFYNKHLNQFLKKYGNFDNITDEKAQFYEAVFTYGVRKHPEVFFQVMNELGQMGQSNNVVNNQELSEEMLRNYVKDPRKAPRSGGPEDVRLYMQLIEKADRPHSYHRD